MPFIEFHHQPSGSPILINLDSISQIGVMTANGIRDNLDNRDDKDGQDGQDGKDTVSPHSYIIRSDGGHVNVAESYDHIVQCVFARTG